MAEVESEDGYEGYHVEDVPKADPVEDDFATLSYPADSRKAGQPAADSFETAVPAAVRGISDSPAEQADLLNFDEPAVPKKPAFTSEASHVKSVSDHPEPAAAAYSAAVAAAPVASSKSQTEIGEPTAAAGTTKEGSACASCGCCWAWLSHVSPPASVWSLLLWHNIPLTGTVLFSTLTILLSLSYFSAISVVSYASLAVLVASATFKVYQRVLATVCKDSTGSCYDFNPFSVLETKDLTLSADCVHRAIDVALPHFNCAVSELKRLILVENVVSSFKFGLVLWALTYVGCCFNGLTLLILDVVLAFTVPKIYDTYKVQIDRQLAVVVEKFNEIYGKLKDRIPYLKKKSD